MHLVAIAWLYVVVMMSVAEAMSPRGTLLGAVFTFLLYGVLPLSIVLYIGGWPGRRRLRRQAEERAAAQAAALRESSTAGGEPGAQQPTPHP